MRNLAVSDAEDGTARSARRRGGWLAAALLWPAAALPHDPVFGLGPHTLFQGGLEFHTGAERAEAGSERETEYALAVSYGLTGDWTVGIELPYVDLDHGGLRGSGYGNPALSTKFRFWRHDTLGVQQSAAIALSAIVDGTAGDEVGSGSTDLVAGLSYGYEGRRWYRWASVRYRRNGTGDNGVERGDRLLVDLVGGIRFRPTGYLEADWVWMLELNGEWMRRARIGGNRLPDTGGREWYLSPGLMWTLRNVAIKTGVQLPVDAGLNGRQDGADFRATLEFEVHY